MRRSPVGASSCSSGIREPFSSNSSLGMVAAQPFLDLFQVFFLMGVPRVISMGT